MKFNFSPGVGLSVLSVIFAVQTVAQQPSRVNLNDYGYVLKTSRLPFLTRSSAHIVSVDANGETAVSFVTRDRMGLATREFPPLSLHLVKFARDGSFLSQGTIPTSSWDDNAILYGSNGTLLIRAGTKLGVYSPQLKPFAAMELPLLSKSALIMWEIFPLPDRAAFVLYADQSMRLLNWGNLELVRKCTESDFYIAHSVSNREIMAHRPSRWDHPYRRTVDISEICGPYLFSYSWEGNTTSAALVDDKSMLLAGGGSSISLVVSNETRWTAEFDKKSDVVADHVEISSDGLLLAVAVVRLVGGSRFLDIDRKLKSVRVVGFQATSGKRSFEIPVNPNPSSRFDFALSPQGDTISIVSDGVLEIHPLINRHAVATASKSAGVASAAQSPNWRSSIK